MLSAAALAIGMHLHSVHAPAHEGQSNANVGLYLRGESWQAGAYRNTIRRNTVYASYVHHAFGLDWHVGAATGYQRKCSRDSATSVRTITTPDGAHHQVAVTDYWTNCSGWSRGAVTPVSGVSYLFPEVQGVKPRLFFAPGLKGSSSVLHLSIERSF